MFKLWAETCIGCRNENTVWCFVTCIQFPTIHQRKLRVNLRINVRLFTCVCVSFPVLSYILSDQSLSENSADWGVRWSEINRKTSEFGRKDRVTCHTGMQLCAMHSWAFWSLYVLKRCLIGYWTASLTTSQSNQSETAALHQASFWLVPVLHTDEWQTFANLCTSFKG